jgi:hypothetical protein
VNPELLPCAGCGLLVVGGVVGCQELFDGESIREYGDVRYAARRRMIVDAYCLQHPDRYCKSAISLAAHMTGVCVAVEHAGDDDRLNAEIQRWLSRRPALLKPPIPDRRGSLTIADLARATNPREHALVADRWAADVWTAYEDLQPIARDWVRQATQRMVARA